MENEAADDKGWDDILPVVKTKFESRLGQPVGTRFSDDVLVEYGSHYIDEPDLTVGQVADKIVDHCADRLQKASEGKPMRDDPVGTERKKARVEAARAARRDRLAQAKAALVAARDAEARAREAERLQRSADRDAAAAAALREGAD